MIEHKRQYLNRSASEIYSIIDELDEKYQQSDEKALNLFINWCNTKVENKNIYRKVENNSEYKVFEEFENLITELKEFTEISKLADNKGFIKKEHQEGYKERFKKSSRIRFTRFNNATKYLNSDLPNIQENEALLENKKIVSQKRQKIDSLSLIIKGEISQYKLLCQFYTSVISIDFSIIENLAIRSNLITSLKDLLSEFGLSNIQVEDNVFTILSNSREKLSSTKNLLSHIGFTFGNIQSRLNNNFLSGSAHDSYELESACDSDSESFGIKIDLSLSEDQLPILEFGKDNFIPIEPLAYLLEKAAEKYSAEILCIRAEDINDWLENKVDTKKTHVITMFIEKAVKLTLNQKLVIPISIANEHFTLLTITKDRKNGLIGLYLDSFGDYLKTSELIKSFIKEYDISIKLTSLNRPYQSHNNDCAIHVYEISKILLEANEEQFNDKWLWQKIKDSALNRENIVTCRRLDFAIKALEYKEYFLNIYSDIVIDENLRLYKNYEKSITNYSLINNYLFFKKLHHGYIIDHRHEDTQIQQEYDKNFGLIIR